MTHRDIMVLLGRAAVAILAVIALALVAGHQPNGATVPPLVPLVPAPAPGPTPHGPITHRPATPEEAVRHQLRQEWEIDQVKGQR